MTVLSIKLAREQRSIIKSLTAEGETARSFLRAALDREIEYRRSLKDRFPDGVRFDLPNALDGHRVLICRYEPLDATKSPHLELPMVVHFDWSDEDDSKELPRQDQIFASGVGEMVSALQKLTSDYGADAFVVHSETTVAVLSDSTVNFHDDTTAWVLVAPNDVVVAEGYGDVPGHYELGMHLRRSALYCD